MAKRAGVPYKIEDNRRVLPEVEFTAELDAAPVTLLQEKLREAIENCLNMELFRAELAKEKEDAAFIAAQK